MSFMGQIDLLKNCMYLIESCAKKKEKKKTFLRNDYAKNMNVIP